MKKSDDICTWTTRQLKLLLNKTEDSIFKRYITFVLRQREGGFEEMNPDQFLAYVQDNAENCTLPQNQFLKISLAGAPIDANLLFDYLDKVLTAYPGSVVDEVGSEYVFYIAWNKILQKSMEKVDTSYRLNTISISHYSIEEHGALKLDLREIAGSCLLKRIITVSKGHSADEGTFAKAVNRFKGELEDYFFVHSRCGYLTLHPRFSLALKYKEYIDWSYNDVFVREKNGGVKGAGMGLRRAIVEKFSHFLCANGSSTEKRASFFLTESKDEASISGHATDEQVQLILKELEVRYPNAVITDTPVERKEVWAGKHLTDWKIKLHHIKPKAREEGEVIF